MNLIQIFWEKEKVFWKRTLTMRKKINIFGFLVATIFIAIGHYAFALMHFLFEIFLFIFWRSMFSMNLKKLQKSLVYVKEIS